MSNKLNVKDLINVGLFSLLIGLFTFLGGMIGFIPVFMPAVPFFAGILSGPICMLYATKIKKPGMILIEVLIIGLLFMVTGHGIWVFLSGLVAGIVAELIMKKGEYKSIKHSRLAFTASSFLIFGNWVPIFTAREEYIKSMVEMGYGQNYADQMMRFLPYWSLLPIMIMGLVGSYIGCTIGIKLLRKHFVRAGMIEEV